MREQRPAHCGRPEVFELQDDDTLMIVQEAPDESLRAKVVDAVRGCPEQAITLQR